MLQHRVFIHFCRKLKSTKDVLFKKYLIVTNMGISCSLSGLGDLILQQYTITKGEKKSLDIHRTQRMSMTGLSVGFVCHFWYNFLDSRLPGKSLSIVFKKVLLDQFIFSPIYITIFFVSCALLEKSNWKELKEEIIDKGKDLYVAEWVVWPPAQIINFYFIPLKYRVLYDNTISLGYDTYTSYIKYKS